MKATEALFNQPNGSSGHCHFLEPQGGLLASLHPPGHRQTQAGLWSEALAGRNCGDQSEASVPCIAVVPSCRGAVLAVLPPPEPLGFVSWPPQSLPPPTPVSPPFLRSRLPGEPPSLALPLSVSPPSFLLASLPTPALLRSPRTIVAVGGHSHPDSKGRAGSYRKCCSHHRQELDRPRAVQVRGPGEGPGSQMVGLLGRSGQRNAPCLQLGSLSNPRPSFRSALG